MNKIHRTGFVQHSFPAIVRHIGYIALPLYYPFYRCVLNIGETADNTSGTIMNKYARKMPTTVNIFAIVLQLLATGVVFLLANRNKLNTCRKLVWTGVTGLVGLPAL